MANVHRERLHGVLRKLCPNVYFQPPSDVRMIYPCIVYAVASMDTVRANNKVYGMHTAYTITVIDRDPENEIPATMLSSFAMCDWNASFVADNLNHTSLTLYY